MTLNTYDIHPYKMATTTIVDKITSLSPHVLAFRPRNNNKLDNDEDNNYSNYCLITIRDMVNK